MSVTEKEIRKEMREHPWADRETAKRIALDHKRRKTTTKEGKRLYMRDYMRDKRQKRVQAFPRLSDVIGLQIPKRRGKK